MDVDRLLGELEIVKHENDRKDSRLRTFSVLTVGLIAALTISVIAFMVMAVAYLDLSSNSNTQGVVLKAQSRLISIGNCRVEKDIEIEQVKGANANVSIEFFTTTDPKRKEEIAEIFREQNRAVAELQQQRLACGK